MERQCCPEGGDVEGSTCFSQYPKGLLAPELGVPSTEPLCFPVLLLPFRMPSPRSLFRVTLLLGVVLLLSPLSHLCSLATCIVRGSDLSSGAWGVQQEGPRAGVELDAEC